MKQMLKKTAVVLSMVMVCAPVGAMAAQKLLVKDSGGTVNKFVISDDSTGLSATDNGYVGVGTAVPAAAIHLKANKALYPGNAVKLEGDEVSNAAGFVLFNNRSDGTYPKTNDRLGFMYFGSSNGGSETLGAGIVGYAEGDWNVNSLPSAFGFFTTPSGTKGRLERMRISNSGNIGIGTKVPTSKLHVVGLPPFANNAAALAGGLTAGAFYRTGADPDVVCVVH